MDVDLKSRPRYCVRWQADGERLAAWSCDHDLLSTDRSRRDDELAARHVPERRAEDELGSVSGFGRRKAPRSPSDRGRVVPGYVRINTASGLETRGSILLDT